MLGTSKVLTSLLLTTLQNECDWKKDYRKEIEQNP